MSLLAPPTSPYGFALTMYTAAGWRGVLPLPPGQKKSPPTGYTGDNGNWPTDTELIAWSHEHEHGNIALRLDEHTIGLDVDAYGDKPGWDTLQALIAQLGPLPDTVMSTSRDDGRSGIRFYRLPTPRKLIGSLPGIEIIQRHHRYAVAWPSTHPDTGNTYQWYDTATGQPLDHPPSVDELPELPAAWIEHLDRGNHTVASTRRLATGRDHDPSPAVLRALGQATMGLHAGTRHDAALAGVTALTRLASLDHPGAHDAIEDLHAAFLAAVGDTRTQAEADGEWQRMLEGAAALVATTSPARPTWDQLERRPATNGTAIALNGHHHAPTAVPRDEANDDRPPINLPDEFWDSRPVLAHIAAAAHNRIVSRDAVLGSVLARVAVGVLPSVTIPPLVGAAASFDLFVAVVSRPGTGKSTSERLADELWPVESFKIGRRPLGSGEGLIEAYMGDVEVEDENGKKKTERQQVLDAVLFHLDEGQALAEVGGRSGSTLFQTLRSAWSGANLGQANATKERSRNLPAGSYRCVLVAGFQWGTAQPLIEDQAGGTPQRFLWLSGEDPAIPATKAEAPGWPGRIARRNLTQAKGPVAVDQAIVDEVVQHAIDRSRGVTLDENPLDAHRNLLRLKVGYLLAVLDERRDVNLEDWDLAGQILDVSNAVRDRIIATARQAAADAARARTAAAIDRTNAIDDSSARHATELMASTIARHVQRGKCGPEGCTRRCTTQATAGKHRAAGSLEEAFDLATSKGWIVAEGSQYLQGPTPC